MSNTFDPQDEADIVSRSLKVCQIGEEEISIDRQIIELQDKRNEIERRRLSLSYGTCCRCGWESTNIFFHYPDKCENRQIERILEA